jgi:leucyl/phenylalanyl-tRNA--protein transferase
MPLYALDNRLWFPPVESAQEDGLLAIGGDLSVQRLLMAYERGIFPWYEGDVPVWWCPNPRFVLDPPNLKVSKSMKQLLKRNKFRFSMNEAFSEVINNCKKIYRHGQDGTWITNEVVASYKKMHEYGYAHSAEVWLNEELVGGLYGIRLGNVFFGESMFSLLSNASKYAFINYVQQLKKEGVQLIDCQVYTEHLESLGASMIPREEFINLLHKYIGEPGR